MSITLQPIEQFASKDSVGKLIKSFLFIQKEKVLG